MAAPVKFRRGAGAPVNLKMDFMDNVASGALLQLGHTQVGSFTKQVVRWGNATGRLQNSLFYFVGEGEGRGAGRFSAGLAAHVQDWVQQAILFPSARKKNVAGGFFGPPRRDEAYVDWLNSIGKGGQPTMYLMGTLASAFTVLRASQGGHTLGIRPSMRVKPPIVGSKPIEFESRSVSVGDYAAAVELGRGMPARPIMTGAIVGWLEKALPAWAKALRQYMYHTYGLGLDSHSHTGVNPLDMQQDAGPSLEVSLKEQLRSAQMANALLSLQVSTVEQADNKLQRLADWYASGAGDNLTMEEVGELDDMVASVCQQFQTPAATVSKIQQAILRGEEPETVAAGPRRHGR